MHSAPIFLCISTSFKGNDFLQSCKDAGNIVFLLTDRKLESKPWIRTHIDEIFYLDADSDGIFNDKEMLSGIARITQKHPISRVIALDDFDIEKAALIREHFRIPGMGQTTARYFRDKLAMRMRAREAGVRVPGFCALFNDQEITEFIDNHMGPWMIKPRSEASSQGIQKLQTREEVWEAIHALQENRHLYLLEQYKAGHVYHIDSLSLEGRVIFSWANQYLAPPFDIAHGGGIFQSVTVLHDTAEARALETITVDVLKAFGMQHSASHTEVIHCSEDGHYYFLETSSRVGGAYLANMIEAASGINLWKEWARMETALVNGTQFRLPRIRWEYAGILISLANQPHPDTSVFNCPELVWKMEEEYHVGLVIQSTQQSRILSLLSEFATIVAKDYHATLPPRGKNVH
jgi:hypothetical protein